MNLDQALSAVRSLIALLGGFAVGKGWIDNSWVVLATGLATWALPLVWGLWSHSDTAKLLAVESMPNTTIVVGPGAPPAAVEAAHDPLRPDVVPK